MAVRKYVIVHHSLTEDSGTVSWGAIRKYHMITQRYTDIGYQFGIEDVNGRPEILIGRIPSREGAHCKELGMNHNSYGVCVIGNFDIAPPSEMIMRSTVGLIRWLMEWNPIPRANVLGHREVGLMAGHDWRDGKYKTCPGTQFDMNHLRQML